MSPNTIMFDHEEDEAVNVLNFFPFAQTEDFQHLREHPCELKRSAF